ncbi:esterase E4-like isoform X2 [Bemisia tabaci]|uniref:esterase E4-like isoform X2 n=1 Tax=Bemisia tabaci TaxID=7038 RepID=UPI003B28D454
MLFSFSTTGGIVLSFLCSVSYCNPVEVTTSKGIIVGSDHLRSRHGKVIYSFTGIPYAKPPVGKLRFKVAEPVEPWQGPLNATGKCPSCAWVKRPSALGQLQIVGQEDCLRLNVYSPSLAPGTRLPVMLYIHGGSYRFFFTMAGPEFLENVVLVDITYRLGVLGFATTGDGVIPGNLGLKDQVLALQWVRDNIAYFGGDPDSVTVFGNSAGGASTHLLLLSPRAKGLLHRGISMSGTAACPWAMIPRQLAIDRTKAFSVLCGCPPEPSKELLECLQEVPIRSIVEMLQKFRDEYYLPLTEFAPIIEEESANNAFLTRDPDEIESEIPWMTGINSADHLSYPYKEFLLHVRRNGLNMGEQLDIFLSKWLSYGFNVSKKAIPSVINKIKAFYFGNESIADEQKLLKLDEVIADGWFLKGLTHAVSKYRGNTYLYYYDYQQSNATFFSIIGRGFSEERGASHMDELLSLFPMTTFFQEDLRLRRMCRSPKKWSLCGHISLSMGT